MTQNNDVFVTTRQSSNPSDVLIYTSVGGGGGPTNYVETVTETVTAASDTVTRTFVGARTATESVAAVDTVTASKVYARSIAETVGPAHDTVQDVAPTPPATRYSGGASLFYCPRCRNIYTEDECPTCVAAFLHARTEDELVLIDAY